MSEHARILVVDDDAHLRRATARVLKRAGYQVTEAGTGAEGLRLANVQRPNLILLDVALPDIDGIEVCRRIKETPALAGCFVVALSGAKTSPDDQASGLEAGADGYIVRPISNRELLARVKALLRIKGAEERAARLNQVLRAIRNVNQLLAREKDRDRMLQGACELLVETRGYHNAWLALFDESGELVTAAEAGLGADFSPMLERLERGALTACGRRALAQAKVVVSEDPPATCADCPLAESYAGRGAMTVRVEHDGRVHGLLSVSIPAHLAADREEQALLREIAGDIAFALHDIALEEEHERAEAEVADLARASDRAAEALRESEERYRSLFEEMPVGLYRTTPEGEIVDANPALVQMLGYPDRASCLATNAADLYVDPADRERGLRALENADDWESVRLKLRRRDGRAIWVLDSGRAIRDKEGRTRYYIGALEDITARVQMEEALRKSKSLLDATGRMARVGGWELDAENLDVRWTEETYRIHEIPLDYNPPLQEAIDFFHPPDRERLSQAIQKALNKGESYDMELRFITAKGKHLWTRTICHPQIVDGKTVKLVGTFQDITERVRAEEALRESEEKYRRLVEGSPNILYIYSDKRGALYWSQRVQQVLGYAPTDLVERPHLWHDAIHPDDVAAVDQAIADHEKGGGFDIEYRIQDIDGHWHWFRDRLISKRRSGDEYIIEGLATDITERKQAEQALRDSEAFLQTVYTHSPVGIYVVDVIAAGEYEYRGINPAHENILGVANDLIQGKSPHVLAQDYGEDVVDYILDLYDTCVRQRQRMEFEEEVVWGDKTISLLTQITPLLDEHGEVYRLIGTVLDITERKRIENALRESEKRFRTIVDALPQFIAYTDKDLVYRFVNRTYREKFEVAPEEVLGKTLSEVIGEEAFEEARPHVERALRGERVRYHERYDYAIGGTRDIDGILVPDIAEDGEVRGYYAVLTDITPYMEMQEELHQYAGRLRIQHEIDTAILAARSPTGIARAVLTRLHNLIPCQLAGIAEIDPSQQRGRDLIVLFHGESKTIDADWRPLSNVGPQAIKAVEQGQPYTVPDMAALATPSHLEQRLMAQGIRSYVNVPLLVQNTLIGTLNLASDTPDFFQPTHVEILEETAASLAVALQQARLLEQTRQDAETKALLLREVNHRVLNNLTMILSILDMEQRHPMDDTADFHAALRDVAGRIGGMATVHRMLSSAQWAPLDLDAVVAKVIHAALSGSPIQRRVEVVVDAPHDPPRVTSRQAIAVALVINELTTNSVKYAFQGRSQGQIHVRIATVGDERDERNQVRLVFRDDGPGMPEEVLTGERHRGGLWLVDTNVKHTLGGEITRRNDGGAVASITFEQAILGFRCA